jgi:L-fuconolactonase
MAVDDDVVDTHVHIWEAFQPGLEWLDHAGWSGIRKAFGTADLMAAMDSVGVRSAVLVNATIDCSENAGLIAASAHERILGVVGCIPLAQPDLAAASLDLLQGAAAFAGVRHMAGWYPEPDLLDTDAVPDVGYVGDRGLVLEVMPRGLADVYAVSRLAERNPGTRVVIDHLAKPLNAASAAEWDTAMSVAARQPNVLTKISGWTTPVRTGWSGRDIRPYVERAVELFGADRLMYASNWPVTLLAGSYEQVWAETNEALRSCSGPERKAIFAGTAYAVYGTPARTTQEGPA